MKPGPTAPPPCAALTGPTDARGGTLLSTALTYEPAVRRRLVSELDGRMDHFGDFRRLGSAALELCAVAEGGVDAYLEYGLFEHDFAAGGLDCRGGRGLGAPAGAEPGRERPAHARGSPRCVDGRLRARPGRNASPRTVRPETRPSYATVRAAPTTPAVLCSSAGSTGVSRLMCGRNSSCRTEMPPPRMISSGENRNSTWER